MVSAFSRRAKWLRLFRLRPTQVIILSFVFMILLGTLLLMLPISTYDGNGVPAIDALFVSTSASCVVGLTVVDLKNELTFFGKLVMLLLIQVGGLGIMTLATLVVHNMGYRFQLSENLILQESLNQKNQAGIYQLIKRMIKYTFVIEGFFALLLAVHFYDEFGYAAIGYGIFHSVSAFCNGGFDLFGNYDSLVKRADDYFLLASLGSLVFLGGIGFTVIYDVIHKRSFGKLTLHSKIALVSSFVMIIFGTALIYFVCSDNPDTIGNLSTRDQLIQSCFMSISCRTAGFNTFDLAFSAQITQLIMIMLMFAGASPLSTGGGVKTTTVFIIFMSMWTVVKGKSELVVFGRKISRDLQQQAYAIFTLGTIWVVTAAVILSVIDGEVHDLEKVIFETVSGFGTVGMGIGITNEWNFWGKLVLIITMLVGRVGIMTFMLAFITQKDTLIKYPEENVMIG